MRIAAVVVSTALVLVSGEARAERTIGSVGLTMAGGFAPRVDEAGVDSGFALGTEASVVHVFGFSGGLVRTPDWWVGGFVSGIRDFESGLSRLGSGVRFGYGLVGVDAGPVMQVEHGEPDVGVMGRAFINVIFVAPYGALGAVPTSDDRGWFGEIGVTVVLPFDLDRHRVFR